MTDRSALYKNEGKDATTMRKNRTERTLTLRKEKREEIMAKRRNIPQDDESDLQNSTYENPITLEELAINAKSQDPNIRREAITRVRKMLSSNRSPPIDDVVNSELLPILVDGLKSDDAELQFEAAWALTNISSGNSEQTHAVVCAGAIPCFVDLLGSDNMKICEQAVWALGNIIGDGSRFRDYCIELGMVESLVKLVRPDISLDFLRNVSWVFVNLCRCKDPPPPMHIYTLLLPAIGQLLHHSDVNILADVLWSIAYTSDAGTEQIQMVVNQGFVKHIVPLLAHNDERIVSVALRCVGNIATGTDLQTQALLDNEVLHFMLPLLSHDKSKIAKEAIWFVSNVTAGTVDQIRAVISADFLPKLIDLLSHGDFVTQKEAVWAITNVVISGDPNQALCVLESGGVTPLCTLLSIADTQIVKIILEGLLNILKKLPDEHSKIAQEIEQCGGLDQIERLQNHESEDIYSLAYTIIDEFFNDAEEGDLDENKEFKLDKSQGPFDQYQF